MSTSNPAEEAVMALLPKAGSQATVTRFHGTAIRGAFDGVAVIDSLIVVIITDENGTRHCVPWHNVADLTQTASARRR